MRTRGVGTASPRSIPALAYFGITFAWTWSLWGTAAMLGASIDQPLGGMLYMAGGLGPLVGAAWLLLQRDPAYRRSFLRRMWDPRGIGVPWWLALVAVAAGPALLGAAVAGIAGAAGTVPSYGIAALVGAVAIALLAGIAEEPGWRGVASDAWQRHAPPASAAIGIGAIWALWHLPLTFIGGTYYHTLGLDSVELWLTKLALVQLGVLFVWLVNGSGGSILLAILAHAGFNVAVSLVPRSSTGDVVGLGLLTAATVLVVYTTHGRLRFSASDRASD